MIKFLSWSYLIILLLSAIIVALRFRTLDKATRTICILIWLGVITEATALVAVRIWHTNYLVYNLSFYLYFLLMMLYFHQSNPA
jgi:hypothetical protein